MKLYVKERVDTIQELVSSHECRRRLKSNLHAWKTMSLGLPAALMNSERPNR
jgi:hypothetical protein